MLHGAVGRVALQAVRAGAGSRAYATASPPPVVSPSTSTSASPISSIRHIEAAEFALGSIAAFVFVILLTVISLERLPAVVWTSAAVLVAIMAMARMARTLRRRRIAVRSR